MLQCQKAPNFGPLTVLSSNDAGNSSCIKQYERREKQLEKTPRTEISGRGNLVVGVKGLIRQWDPSKSLDGQETLASNVVLQFDTEVLKAYKEFGK